MIGKSVAHYRITEKIGSGGMGDVYRAHDSKLGRDVALKVLPEAFVQDAARMARFTREAQLLASLNHPNIAAIYGVEELEGTRCLVLELVEGQTLADRVERGPVPVEEAIPIALQIARALENAHERGIIHRDLKPANIKITPEGVVKVLDFGLAKALSEDSGELGDLSQSPTLSPTATGAGVILGTAAYMSPEQAKGKRVDRRADIWSFGIVLLEMLTGKPVYRGETISETLAQVMMSEPEWDGLSPATPKTVRRLLERCLRKDPMSRLRDIGEARIQLEEMPHEREPAEPSPTRERSGAKLAWLLAAAMALVAVFAIVHPFGPESSSTPVRLELTPDASLAILSGPALALSPDGSRLVYVAGSSRDSASLYIRSLSELESIVLSGTDSARQPFFSPDGEWVAFFARGELKKVSVHGGAAITLCQASEPRGGSWGEDDTIVFNRTNTDGLWTVSADGGEPVALTTLSGSEYSHRWPHHLPDGRHVLFTSVSSELDANDASIEVISLDSGDKTVVYRGGFGARYLESGHLAFVRDGALYAAPFDVGTLQLAGQPVLVVPGVASDAGEEIWGAVQFSVSRAGNLIYLPGTMRGANEYALVWVDRDGTVSTISHETASFRGPRLSPDGSRLVVEIGNWNQSDLWVYELERDAMTRLTFADGPEWNPAWSPDGQRIAYGKNVAPSSTVSIVAADGASEPHVLVEAGEFKTPGSFSPDGKLLVFNRQDPETNHDIWIRPLDEEGEPRIFLKTPFAEGLAQVSPDGRWLVYQSNESGHIQAVVTSFPDGAGRWQVSTDGGAFPVWSPSSQEIFYRSSDGERMMAVSYTTEGNAFHASRPRELFRGRFRTGVIRNYDVSPDSERFVMIQSVDDETAGTESRPVVVLNWFTELERLVPTE